MLEVHMSEYCNRRSGGNPVAKRIDLGPISIWFSYTTPIAFKIDGEDRVVRENCWGPTTGKHLNDIDGGGTEARSLRVAGSVFKSLMNERIGRFFFPRDLDANCPAFMVADWLRDRGMDRAADAVQGHEMQTA